ncbi:aspartic proteinase nepenthesin-1-like [Telopea speciosissima]|uniref:aspartic proteinase nepenthesin-1-like n=1 Tax=Telopea speciosissima TaxID=54955 RepID=UPI001CC443CD|nr:aspartic proteinase nepenthesin-1-like [Telopea speciosissima]
MAVLLQALFLFLAANFITFTTANTFSAELIPSNPLITPFKNPNLILSLSEKPDQIKFNDDIRKGLQPDPVAMLYLAKFSIGTPAIEVLTAMDTGSNLFWVQCFPCHPCFQQSGGAYYFPSNSLTFNQTDHLPYYTIVYAGKSYSKGNLAGEVLTFADDVDYGYVSKLPNIIFGCGNDNNFYDGNGVLGLGPGNLSLVSQLGNQAKFSYCFNNATDPTQVGNLILGYGAQIDGSTTPMADYSTQYYYITLEGISVGQERLKIPPATFERKPNRGGGGAIIDSGSTFTYLAIDAYNKLREKLESLLSKRSLQAGKFSGYGMCYGGSVSRDLTGFPTMKFHFKNKAELEAQYWTFFRQVNEEIFCLTMAPTTSDTGITIIGNLVQQGYNVGYDLVNKVISFKYIDCSPISAII